MRRVAAFLVVSLAFLARPGVARESRGHAARGTLTLGGEQVEVRWTDGDTFVILTGSHARQKVRLQGVNALEAYGPVHRIGTMGGWELLEIAERSARIAADAGGRCELEGAVDGYGRLLGRCPEAAAALVRTGHAMVFAVNAEPDAALLELQADAQRRRAGMWAGGAPRLVPTSLHSADEPDLGRRQPYDRIVDTRTGVSKVRRHDRVYRACEEVCLGEGPDRACMIYVPFAGRYRDKPDCLRGSGAGRDP